MSKRKLSRKQTWRAQKIQEERIKRAKKKQSNAEEQLQTGQTDVEEHGRVIVCYGVHYIVEDSANNHVHCLARQNLGSIVVGDNVIWQRTDNENGIITAVLERKSLLERPNFHGNTKLVAVNIDQIFIVCSPLPSFQTALIDRYLVAVELTHIKPVIVVNKIDLLNKEQLSAIQNDLADYTAIGYEVLFIASKTKSGLDQIKEKLKDKVSILVGQSGVGKSSLLNKMFPE